MVVGREHEADAGLGQAAGDLVGRERDASAQRLHHIGRPRGRRHAATTMLADPGACSGGDKHGASRDVEGVGTVATRAHNIHQMAAIGHLDLGGELPHDLRCGGDFANGFFFHAQTGQDGGRHQGRDLAIHDHAHEVQHFIVKDLTVLDGALQGFAGCDAGHGCCIFKKLFNKAWPCSVSTDSG